MNIPKWPNMFATYDREKKTICFESYAPKPSKQKTIRAPAWLWELIENERRWMRNKISNEVQHIDVR